MNSRVGRSEAAWVVLQSRLALTDNNRNLSLDDYMVRNNRMPPGIVRNMSTEGIQWEPLPTDTVELRELIVAELRGIKQDDYESPGVWLGINYRCVTASVPEVGALARHPDRPLIVHMNEAGWKKNLPTFPTLGFGPPSMIELHDGVAENKSVMVEDLLGRGGHCVVRYWGLEIEDNNGEGGDKGNGDPRAQILCKALSGHSFPYAYHFVYAQVTRITPTIGESKPRVALPEDGPSTFSGLKKGFLATLPQLADLNYAPEPNLPHENGRSGGEDVAPPIWSDVSVTANHDDVHDSTDMRAEVTNLNARAKQQADSGDHKAAYTTVSDAMSLHLRTLRAEATMAISPTYNETPAATSRLTDTPALSQENDSALNASSAPEPGSEIRKTYFPEAQYLYPDGRVRTVAAGMYTSEEFLARTMEEQGLWAEAQESGSREV
jgi:hypothetical protein